MVTDPIADLLTRLRNAQRAGHPTVTVPASKTKGRILQVLLDEGFIESVQQSDDSEGKPSFRVFLRYYGAGKPVIRAIRRLSRPGKRVYVGREEIPTFKGGLGVVIVSTSRGMLTDRVARKDGIGGELVCSIF